MISEYAEETLLISSPQTLPSVLDEIYRSSVPLQKNASPATIIYGLDMQNENTPVLFAQSAGEAGKGAERT